MNFHPIVFTGNSPAKVRDGSQTQTRRVLKFDVPDGYLANMLEEGPPDDPREFAHNVMFYAADGVGDPVFYGTPYRVGDGLWVREPWKTCQGFGDEFVEFNDGEMVFPRPDGMDRMPRDWRNFARQRPPRFMFKWSARTFLRVTEVRVQRVQEISEADAEAEVVNRGGGELFWTHFAEFWDSLNAKRGYPFEADPWVIAYTFERCDKPEGWPGC